MSERPKGFAQLLRWFLEGFVSETAESMHAPGVYVARPARVGADGQPVENVPSAHIGGSVLGSPRHAEPFRQMIENSPRQTTDDETGIYYVRPMRAALARLGRKLPTEDGAMGQFLEAVAYSGGDWEAVGERAGIPWFARRAFTEVALRRLYHVYRPEPPLRGRPKSESQQRAESTDLREAIQ